MPKSWKTLVAAVVIAGGASSIAIADGYEYEPVGKGFAPPRVYSWTGFYIGANAGYAWGDSDVATRTNDAADGYFFSSSVSSINSNGSGSLKPRGFTGGGQIGYNFQTGNWVWGLETDFQSFRQDKTRTVGPITYPDFAPTTYTIVQKVDTDWLYTLRPRLGWAANDWLIYATGGLAVTRLKTSFSFADTFDAARATGTTSSTKAGWTVGGGAEVRVNSNWTVKGEYLFVDFNSESLSSNNLVTASDGPFPATVFKHSADLQSHIVRGGINYKF